MKLLGSFRVGTGVPLEEDEMSGGNGGSERAPDSESPLEGSDNHNEATSSSLLDESGAARTSSQQNPELWPGDEGGSRSNAGGTVGSLDNPDASCTGGDTTKKGKVTKTEVYIVAAIAVAVIAAIIVVAVVVTGKDSGGGSADELEGPTPTAAPTPAPSALPYTKMEQLDTILFLLGNLTSTAKTLDLLPNDDTFYDSKSNDATQPAVVRAMSWILNEDPSSHGPSSPWLPIRFALATLYYNNGGTVWLNSTNWLTGAPTCDWYGVSCDKRTKNKLEQIDLQSNNMQNQIPNEIALLKDCRAIWFRRNNITGTIPARAFNDLLQLQDLYLESNVMTGKIPSALAKSVPPLTTLFIQQNSFKGLFPPVFCSGPGQTAILERFGVDCDRNGCICCSSEDHCF